MELSLILNQLGGNYIKTIGNQDMNMDIVQARLLESPQQCLSDNIIYIGKTEQLPPPYTAGIFSILCTGKEPDEHLYDSSTFSIIFVEDTSELFSLYNKVQDVIMEHYKISANMQILTNAFFSERGLQYLVDVAYHVFGNPIYVIDSRHKYLAVSSGITIEENSIAYIENKDMEIMDEGIKLIQRMKLSEQLHKNHKPIYFNNPLHKKGMLIDTITINNVEVGHLMLYELDKPIVETDYTMLHQTSRIVSMELQKNSFIRENKGFMYSYFLEDLLDNVQMHTNIKERLISLGFNLKKYMYIIVIPPYIYQATKAKTDTIIEQFRLIINGSINIVYENNIVVFFSRDNSFGLSDFERQQLEDFLKVNELIIGMSNFFTEIKNIKDFYNHAIKAIELGMKFNPDTLIHLYSDYYLFHMFEICEVKENLNYFVNPSIMKLYYYDEENGSELLKTLKAYIDYSAQTVVAAKTLNIHRNTFLYRIDKIKSIINNSLTNGNDLMSFNISYHILTYLNMI